VNEDGDFITMSCGGELQCTAIVPSSAADVAFPDDEESNDELQRCISHPSYHIYASCFSAML